MTRMPAIPVPPLCCASYPWMPESTTSAIDVLRVGSPIRSKDHFQSAACTGRPLWNLTLSRRVNVYTSPFGEMVQFFAACGMMRLCASKLTNVVLIK